MKGSPRVCLSMLVMIVVAAAVSACGSSGSSGSSASSGSPGAASSNGNSGSSGSSGPIQVRVITATPTNAGTWDPANYAAYEQVAKANGWKLQIAQAVPYGKGSQVLTTWGQQGVKAVFLTDAGFQQSMLSAAKQFPKTKFITMSNITTTDNLPNVAAYSIDWCQLGLLQGIAAALISKNHSIVAMQGLPIPPAVKQADGIKVGAQIASPGTKVKVADFNSVTDAGTASSATTAALGNGPDVAIGDVLGGTVSGVVSAAQGAGDHYVGAYANEAHFGPKAFVTSGLIGFTRGYQKFAQELRTGHFTPTITATSIQSGSIKLLVPFHGGFAAAQKKAEALQAEAIHGKFTSQLASCEKAS